MYMQLRLQLRCHVCELSHGDPNLTRVIHLQACHKHLATACDASLDISTKRICAHEHLQCRSPAQAQHPSPLHGPPGPGPLPLAPGPPPAVPGPHHNGPGPGPLPQAPSAAPVARGPPQPLTQFPVELGNFINKLPPARALEGGHPNVDQVYPSWLSISLIVCPTVMCSHVLLRHAHHYHSLVYTGLSALFNPKRLF